MLFRRDTANGRVFEILSYELLNNSEIKAFAVTTPTNKTINLGFIVRGGQDFTVEIFENASVTGGTAVTPVNLNRRTSKTSSVIVVDEPTINNEGTLLFGYAAGNNSSTGNIYNRGQLILKKNTTYLYKITSKDNANRIGYSGIWIEK